jgi:hypothetical protein
VKKIKKIFTLFPTNQSEAKLLYFYSLFFSVKKPFQKTKLFIALQCKCVNSSEVKKVTGLGCINGGTPYCPGIANKGHFCKVERGRKYNELFVVKSALIFQDGSYAFCNNMINYNLEGRKGCICKDGIHPR